MMLMDEIKESSLKLHVEQLPCEKPGKKLAPSVGFTPMTSEILEQYSSNIVFEGAISLKSKTNQRRKEVIILVTAFGANDTLNNFDIKVHRKATPLFVLPVF